MAAGTNIILVIKVPKAVKYYFAGEICLLSLMVSSELCLDLIRY